ncbi:MAG TPA: prephenate dehydrogenase/arogenate dehydrogenase family protein [Vicinamibacterales bacterium]|jgi:prephenate dehydrogenase|nr:prephenate dehydrogenase/arogenate dehydrogenase family protein [Vicinamibacterales bacterium]|tara:strand:- start:701 stop:1615 length:915 start_codon:yes stop_codon:yes gene_type:complete
MTERKSLPVLPDGGVGKECVFERIGIFGLGLIGGSIALAARENWSSGLVIGVDDKSVLEQAMQLHAIDVAASEPEILGEADLVILAAPIGQNLKLLEVVSQYVSGHAVITDVGGTKRTIVEAARRLPARFEFVGGNPLAGAPRQGIRNARSDLFKGRPWILTSEESGEGGALGKLGQFVEGLGANPLVMDTEDHDRLVATLSHLPQLTASALMHVLGTRLGQEHLALSGRSVLDATKLASSSFDLWRDICTTNADEIESALDDLIAVLKTLRRDLETGDQLVKIFLSANQWREVLRSSAERAGR